MDKSTSKFSFIISMIIFLPILVLCQNTVGVITYDINKSSEGFNLIYPHNQSDVFLLNACGQIVHQWTDDPEFRPGNTAYILENGNLFKTKKSSTDTTRTIGAGGSGGIIELRDWDNNLLWTTSIMDSEKRAHHDIAPMPNGNVLIVIWERIPIEDVVAAGRDTSLFTDDELWPDYIIEMDPVIDSIVWEWHAWDHIIQEFDSTKPNYGIVNEHPELIDLNYDLRGFGGRNDWLHVNSIDYNERLDQILLSVPFFHEIWIIDHSTTTEEARGHEGGNSGMGGDLLYRWGNPRAYGKGEEDKQQLFFQHDAHWVDDFVDTSHPQYGSIAVYNNRTGGNYSTVNALTPQWNPESQSYLVDDEIFLPAAFDLVITHPDTFPMFSGGLSSVQFLENENVLIDVGRKGYSFELTPENEIVWEYITPLSGGIPVSQGESTDANNTFRIDRYPLNYPGFIDREMIPSGFIELNPDTTFCELLSTGISDIHSEIDIAVYPNPVSELLTIEVEGSDDLILSMYNIFGQKVLQQKIREQSTQIRIQEQNLKAGIYILMINEKFASRVIISN